MKEGHEHIPGMETPRSVIDSQAAQNQQEREKPQLNRMVLNPSSLKDTEKKQEGVTLAARFMKPLPGETPQEQEKRIKWQTEAQKKWDYAISPEGQREFVRILVRQAKDRGILPPDLDHLWLNLPSGWAEYTEIPAGVRGEKPSYTVSLDQTPTQAQWDTYYPDLQKKLEAWNTEKAKREHAGDSDYDPMTGELLKPDEHPLSGTAEYLITGKTRPRRFVPPGSPHVKQYKPLNIPKEDIHPEGERNERLVRRLLKAGFTEVAPVGDDWDYFAFCERLRNMSPYEVMRESQEMQRRMREGRPMEYIPENYWLPSLYKKMSEYIQALIDEGIEENGRKQKQ